MPAPDTGTGTGTARAKASPLARRIAARWGLELAGVPGSGPQGRVIRADVERALAGQEPIAASDGVQELTTVQRTVARRMAQARRDVPDIELRRLVDMTECVNLRAGLRAVSEPAPTYNDFIVKAVALALRDFPRVNSRYVEDRFEHQPRISVGIAVAAEDALLVPTILDADKKSLGQIAAESRAVAARAREGAITPAELDGATFTVSNLGMYDVDSFSAIINPPQSAILAVGSVSPRPVVDAAGDVVARQTVILSLACDHRILYGADGALFLGRVASYLERPLALMLG
jgi:pyruvate dehydrogenase E2 component (dihydrolipoyllysine-residue acetyltransferase)